MLDVTGKHVHLMACQINFRHACQRVQISELKLTKGLIVPYTENHLISYTAIRLN